MPARRGSEQTADLFTAAAEKIQPPGQPAVERKTAAERAGTPGPARYLLPGNLPDALARLSDREIDALLAATTEEARRRGRLPGRIPGTAPQDERDAPPGRKRRTQWATPPRSGDSEVSLTQGQVNAVRAAYKAGVKPGTIARQFRISLSEVRKVIASEARERTPRR